MFEGMILWAIVNGMPKMAYIERPQAKDGMPIARQEELALQRCNANVQDLRTRGVITWCVPQYRF